MTRDERMVDVLRGRLASVMRFTDRMASERDEARRQRDYWAGEWALADAQLRAARRFADADRLAPSVRR